jgi:uncharacterized protein DUF3616
MRTMLFAAILLLHGAAAQAQGAPTVYQGACDGSAAVALDDHHFVAANDDENSLRLYRIGVSNPLAVIDLNPVLRPETKKKDGRPKEVDIEAAARIGDRIYWLGSHARDSGGGKESSRHRFFATDIGKTTGAPPFILKPTQAYTDLLKQLVEQLPGLNLKEASEQAPESAGGFNIEGLAAAPGGELMIGLRNPRPDGRAIVVPLTNPAAVVDGTGKPRFGTPERIDLGKRGIRSIEYVGERYVIVAGPFGDDDNDFALFTWSGPGGSAPRRETGVTLGTLKPEALFATADPKEVYLLSDDGTTACKELTEQNSKTFRGLTVRLN